MPQTLSSSLTPLCPVSEFLKRVDRLAVAKLASDDVNGVPVPDGNLATNDNVLAALFDATGLFESAALGKARYSAADLQLLLVTECGARGMMFNIITNLAWTFLFNRRPNMNVVPPPTLQFTNDLLERLWQGTRIFGFEQTADAGVMELVQSSQSDIEERNGVVFQAEPYFGRRCDRSLGGRYWGGN